MRETQIYSQNSWLVDGRRNLRANEIIISFWLFVFLGNEKSCVWCEQFTVEFKTYNIFCNTKLTKH